MLFCRVMRTNAAVVQAAALDNALQVQAIHYCIVAVILAGTICTDMSSSVMQYYAILYTLPLQYVSLHQWHQPAVYMRD
jgi:hypothetical protein